MLKGTLLLLAVCLIHDISEASNETTLFDDDDEEVAKPTTPSLLAGCSSPAPILDGASIYNINNMVVKYNCLAPYRGHAYSRCNSLTKQWSRVNLTCVNVKLPPDQPNSLRKKFLTSVALEEVVVTANALDGIQLSDMPPPLPPNTHLVAHQVVSTPSLSPPMSTQRPRADAVVKTCGIPPHIAGTIFIVVNEYMVKYACIDDKEGAVRWKNYAYYFCTPEQRSWRGSPPDCGQQNRIETETEETDQRIRLRARKLQTPNRQEDPPITNDLKPQHRVRSMPTVRTAESSAMLNYQMQFNPESHALVMHNQQQQQQQEVQALLPNPPLASRQLTRKSEWMAQRQPQQYYPPVRRPSPYHHPQPRQAAYMGNPTAGQMRPPVHRFRNQQRRFNNRPVIPPRMLSESNDLLYQGYDNHFPTDRRRMFGNNPDLTDLVTSSSAQLTEPIVSPPTDHLQNYLQDKPTTTTQSTPVTTMKRENVQMERLKLRSETEFSVATIGDVVFAQNQRRKTENSLAQVSNRHQREHQSRANSEKQENELGNGERDEEAELELESSRHLSSKSESRCDSTRACTASGPRIGRRASVVYRSFSSDQACPGDFVRIACQSGHNTSWHTSFCTHRRYWTFVPTCGG